MARTLAEMERRLAQVNRELIDMETLDRGWSSLKVDSLKGEKFALEEDIKKLKEATEVGDPNGR